VIRQLTVYYSEPFFSSPVTKLSISHIEYNVYWRIGVLWLVALCCWLGSYWRFEWS